MTPAAPRLNAMSTIMSSWPGLGQTIGAKSRTATIREREAAAIEAYLIIKFDRSSVVTTQGHRI
jgi:hypothetical protein